MNTEKNISKGQIQIRADEKVLRGVYSNLLRISHQEPEFYFDFINYHQEVGQLVSRVISSPSQAKKILEALEKNIKIYEDKFGTIEKTEGPKKEIGFQTES